MKKLPFKKLALTAETIRNLRPADLRAVGGGLNTIIVTTSHSITSACDTFTIVPAGDPADGAAQ